jgi:tetratricopeptide (TPR) repeat protein
MLHVRKLSLISIALLALAIVSNAMAGLSSDLQHLQDRWAEINYQMQGKAQESAFDVLVSEADTFVAQHPASAEVLIWTAIIKSTYASTKGGLGALALVKTAKTELEAALNFDANALQGSAYTSLGALYYSVPGWPVGFGDEDKAEELLKQGLAINPDGIDPNFFYASFLITEKRYAEARSSLEKAQKAAPRPGRTLADSGRRQEVTAALAAIAGK